VSSLSLQINTKGATLRLPLLAALGIKVSMKYTFDFMEFERSGQGKVTVYRYGCEKGLEYSVSLKNKNWIEKLTSSEETKKIPNIVLKRTFRGMKLVFTKPEASSYKFTLVSWFIPIGIGARSMYYATQSVVNSFISAEAGKNA